MSRDVLIATVTTVVFLSSIGGALWYGGYTTTLAKLASLEELLPTAESTKQVAGTSSGNSNEPLPPMASTEIDQEKKTEIAAQSTPAAPALPKESVSEPKESVATFDKAEKKASEKKSSSADDFLDDMALPSLDGIASPAKTQVAEPKIEAATTPPAVASEAKLVETVPKVDSMPALPEMPTSPVSNASSPEPAAEMMIPPPPSFSEDEAKPAEPAIPSVSKTETKPASERDVAKQEELPTPDEPAPVSMTPPTVAEKVESAPPTDERAIEAAALIPAPPAIVKRTAEVLPVSKTDPVSDEVPKKPVAARATPTNHRPIPAPPGAISARSKPVDDEAGTTPAQPKELSTAPATPAQESPVPAGDVIARAQPTLAGESGVAADTILSRAEPIARAAAPAASSAAAGALSAVAPTAVAVANEFVPLHRRGNRYASIGEGGASGRAEEFYPVNNLPAGSNVAYGETTIVSRKAGNTDVPQVVSYDVSIYLALDGDSYESIAQTMYKSPGLGESLARFNGNRSSATTTVPVGSRVRIPPVEVLGGSGKKAGSGSNVAADDISREAFKRVEGGTNARPAPMAPGSARSAFDNVVMEAAPGATTAPGTYRAERTETLWAVSAKTLGDGRRWREIYDLNKDRLPIENQVAAGTLLRLPKSSP
jgi:nucleoid-associated protein YgaU